MLNISVETVEDRSQVSSDIVQLGFSHSAKIWINSSSHSWTTSYWKHRPGCQGAWQPGSMVIGIGTW